MKYLLIFAVIFVLFGSIPSSALATSSDSCKKTVRLAFHADTDFTPKERAEILAATLDWAEATHGRFVASVDFDVDFSSTSSVVEHAKHPMIVRMMSWMPVVFEIDSNFSSRYGRRVTVQGWTDEQPLRIILVVDRIYKLRYVTVHELGHAAGVSHTSDPDSIMSPAYAGQENFTQYDLAVCLAACLCP